VWIDIVYKDLANELASQYVNKQPLGIIRGSRSVSQRPGFESVKSSEVYLKGDLGNSTYKYK